MGQVDVSELMSDPTFVSPVTLIKRIPLVDAYGENQLTEVCHETVGCVQPVSGNTLQRIPEAFRVANVQSFWIRHKIVADSTNRYPDTIVSKKVRFSVQMVFDWSAWGDGWSEGVCVQEKPTL